MRRVRSGWSHPTTRRRKCLRRRAARGRATPASGWLGRGQRRDAGDPEGSGSGEEPRRPGSGGFSGSGSGPSGAVDRAVDETAVLPPVRDAQPADRVPPGFFRDDAQGSAPAPSAQVAPPPVAGNDQTRELPQIDPERPARRRSDWAEETPLDDLPTLADELLGPREDDDDIGGARGGRGRSGR